MKKTLITLLFLFACLLPSSATVGDVKMSKIITPSEPLSTRWTFVVDGSSSLWYKPRQNTCKMLNKSRLAFIVSISQPSDDLRFSIFLFGGETLKNFALALIIGFTLGAYSSIFIASTLLSLWRETRVQPKPVEILE